MDPIVIADLVIKYEELWENLDQIFVVTMGIFVFCKSFLMCFRSWVRFRAGKIGRSVANGPPPLRRSS